MILHDCKQGGEEWLRLRMGLPTASAFDQIVTPGGKASTSAESYMHFLLAEMILGGPLEGVTMPWMERGKELEPEAVALYDFRHDCESKAVGFITNDAGTIGASPDRIVGNDGLLEVKCPKPEKHMGYLMMGKPDKSYNVQLQGQLWVCEREWVDIFSFCPRMPSAELRVYRDEAFIKLLAAGLDAFVASLAAAVELIRERGWLNPPEVPQYVEDPLGITDADVDAIIAARFPAPRADAKAPEFDDFPDPMEFNVGDVVNVGGETYTPNLHRSAWERFQPAEVHA